MTVNITMENKIIDYIDAYFPEEKQRMVLGDGKRKNPTIALVGEAPGRQEVEADRPFVGQAGKNLDVFLQSIHLQREDLYITNVVKFRPTKKSQAGNLVNRTPTTKEIQGFTPFLLDEIITVNPKVIVTLGNTPLYALAGEKTIGLCHGKPRTINVAEKNYTLFPLYHPAAVIYNRQLKATYQEDLKKLHKWLQGYKNHPDCDN